MIKRWYRNLKWLLNSPPTSITKEADLPPCDFCEKGCPVLNVEGYFTICFDCLRKVMDKALKDK